ncbi:hypothetical protein CEUSTIGMA_g3043.t1 [Chlamydomonas eustigma]|uniref:Uncharacterized protein n=1 Tax=Chlamydomonas eustigma TaxID=1157962 RepID=A0A250WY30_9CHLO|nr:hypothetical protein CEUSTIGMA_g3043.t1 [Chlamydomonas eustigma]|eukprot:GAX75599.1 hypothetical protein CEUSTIGMA_g3043.t1 [Chlamydomonas eustigma]
MHAAFINYFNLHLFCTGSVDAQIAYSSQNPEWVANRTYDFEVHSSKDKSVRIRFGAVNTDPFVTKYGKVVLGHHLVFGPPTSANAYNAAAYNANNTDVYDLGRPDANGNPSWASASMRKKLHGAAVNHPTTNGYTTAYVTSGTSGAGSLPDTACIMAAYRSNLHH